MKKLHQREEMSQYHNISICQETVNIIDCPQKDKNAYLFQHQGYTNKMDSEY